MKKYPYLYTFSSTVICLINTLFALASLAFLFRTMYTFGTLIGTLIRAFQVGRITDLQDHLLELFHHLSLPQTLLSALDSSIHMLTYSYVLLGIITFFIIFFFVLLPFLIILNGAGSFSLRFGLKGSQMLRGVHVTYSLLDLLGITGLITGTIFVIFGNISLEKLLQVKKVDMIVIIILVCLTVLLLAFFISLFCFHRDIASQMFYITAQRNNAPIALKRNHLSALSLFFAILCAAAFGSSIYYTHASTKTDILIAEAWLLFTVCKCLCIAASNKQLTASAKHFL